MNITVKITNVYGNETIYPVCEQSQLFARLAGTKTLTRSAIELIKKMGYTVQVQQAVATL
jgi:hypothetical protein